MDVFLWDAGSMNNDLSPSVLRKGGKEKAPSIPKPEERKRAPTGVVGWPQGSGPKEAAQTDADHL